jgi:hypothetical protein
MQNPTTPTFPVQRESAARWSRAAIRSSTAGPIPFDSDRMVATTHLGFSPRPYKAGAVAR